MRPSSFGAQRLLGRAVRPTAVFAGADIVAMGVLTAVAEAGPGVRRTTAAPPA